MQALRQHDAAAVMHFAASSAVAESVADAGSVLITGPASAKTELVEHIRVHDPELNKLIVGVETVDHPSDAQPVAHARKCLMVTGGMRP